MAGLEVSAGRGVEAGGGRFTGETGGFAQLPSRSCGPLAVRLSSSVRLEHAEKVRAGRVAVNGV